MKRQSQQGIALVITLILLSVITFMAVTFLVVSRREGEQVDTTTQQNVSRMAAEGMEQQAVAQIIANLMAQNNGFTNLGLIVSTNYQTQGGYDPTTPANLSVADVGYTYANGQPLSTADLQQMLNNLLYLPRPPVFISTNKNQPNPEFRYYLDENGNGMFETNGLVTNTDVTGKAIQVGGVYQTSIQVGDPEWVGFLEHPDQRHSASNFFLSRGAFIAIPIGDALDVNYIHNQSRLSAPLMASTPPEGYYRNQGVSPAEINLAAFLATLNTNVWGPQTNSGDGFYNYATAPSQTSAGTAFKDAAAIMQYRNSGIYNALNSFQGLYGNNAVVSYLGNGAVDAYSVGPLMTGVNPPFVPINPVSWATSPWSGANNPVQLVRPRDLLTMIPNPSGASLNSFSNRLYSIGLALDTYDRYTFYRLLGQMGFSSAPEPAPYPAGGSSQPKISQILPLPIPTTLTPPLPGYRNQMSYGTVPEPYPYVDGRKMNLNYNNVRFNATNFIPWTNAVEFFTNAADRLLRAYYPTNIAIVVDGNIVITNININFIPIYPVNYYTPGVHRLLQLAANMYDATTNKSSSFLPIDYPSVFRPFFATATSAGGTNLVYIGGYTEQQAALAGGTFWNKPLDLRKPTDLAQLIADSKRGVYPDPTNAIDNVYGAPYVVGARTNLPNFNQFSMAPIVQITRQLQLVRTGTTLQTNVSYVIGVSNVMGLQCWNSGTNYQGRPINILFTNEFSMLVTNNFGAVPLSYPPQIMGSFTNILRWPAGYVNGQLVASSFQPFSSNLVTISNFNVQLSPGAYSTNGTVWNPVKPNPATKTYFLPDWGVIITNNLRAVITDQLTGRILDCVQLGGLGQIVGLDSQDDVTNNLYVLDYPNTNYNIYDPTPTQPAAAISQPVGFFNQMRISMVLSNGQPLVPLQYWASAPTGQPSLNSVTNAIAGFDNWLTGTQQGAKQVPFSPTVSYAKVYTWCANDPLVHYMVGDLTDLTLSATNKPQLVSLLTPTNVLYKPLTVISARYRPWGNVKGMAAQMSLVPMDELEFKDPLITQSQDWQFLTNKYPNVGWLGRVHRGTPWQTVYLKSHGPGYANTFAANWQYWTGNPDPADAANTLPTSDWTLLDLFTTAPNDNASRGQLSVNQTNLAAWAAVLDGVMVISNTPLGFATNISVTQSSMVGNTLTNTVQYLVSSINAQRNAVGGTFSSMGQLFSTPQLTVASPYLNTSTANISDAMYERIPQQIGSLLRVGTPRYEIYAYGQALKPADKSIVQSGQFFGMPTNYQITGEVLTRTVVRFDNFPVPGQPRPGTQITYALPIQGMNSYALVTNTVPPTRVVVESFEILGPDQ